ncbi:hypothetical protein J0H58_29015 [bacterium]|nr:hypothetical protein [bacterium]
MNRPAVLYPALVVGFLLVRAGLFAVTTAGEYRLFRDYGEAARSAPLAKLYRTRDIEYPHLAVLFGAAPAWLADRLPAWAPVLVSLRPNKFESPYTDDSPAERVAGDRYEVALGLVLFAVDVASLALVWLVARRVYPHEPPLARAGRLALYVVATGTVGLIYYDRQDPVVGLVALVAVWALAEGRPRAGYAVLAAGAAYKLVPALLLPVWVFAAAAARPGRFGWNVVKEAVVAGAFLAAWPVLTYVFGGGERGFLFLTYHSARGLQLEAPVAWPVFLLDPAARVGHGFGSYNVTGDLADRVAAAAKWLMLLALPVTVGVAARGFWRASRSPVAPAALVPHAVASALLVWLGFIAANKVGSPQYLHWVLPLVALLPLRGWGERGWVALLLAAGGLTTLVFPCVYPLVRGPQLPTDPVTWGGPGAHTLFLLAARSVTLVAAAVWLGRIVWRAAAVPPTPPISEARP